MPNLVPYINRRAPLEWLNLDLETYKVKYKKLFAAEMIYKLKLNEARNHPKLCSKLQSNYSKIVSLRHNYKID